MDFINSINTINSISGNGIEVKPVIHFKVEIISREKGAHRSAVGYAAYCARTRLRNERDGSIYDWSRRNDIVFSKIMLPENALRRYFDRYVLWNEVEKVEKNKNAQLARTLVIALPTEFSVDTRERVVCQYVQDVFVNRGMCADINIHDKGDGNPHAHIILTMRAIDTDGNWMSKQQKICRLDKNGDTIYDKMKRQYKCTTRKTTDWDNRKNVEQWRERWAELCNKEFGRLGLSKRVTHESYERQGSDILPTKHLGSSSTAMERRGIQTKTGKANKNIYFQNMKLIFDMINKTFQLLMEKFKKMIKQFKQQLAQESPEKTLTICGELSLALYNPEYEIPKFPQFTQGYQQYTRKYTRTHSRSFVPSL